MEIVAWLLALLCLAAAFSAAWLRERRSARRASSAAEAAMSARQTSLRLLRLSASDQRNLALTLFSHAEALEPARPALAGLARRLMDMSEELTEQTEVAEAARRLTDEVIGLMPALEFAVAQVSAHLGPSRRAWRIGPAFDDMRLRADRRAFNQVLVNVLSNAAACTRDGDWIEISAEPLAGGCALVVLDEGIGLPVAESETQSGKGRGIGLQLTLARSLMQAHGGNLTVESTARVGTRVRLGFPADRILQPAAHAVAARDLCLTR